MVSKKWIAIIVLHELFFGGMLFYMASSFFQQTENNLVEPKHTRNFAQDKKFTKNLQTLAYLTKTEKPKICIFMGTRPELIKVAPLVQYLKNQRKEQYKVVLISSGQHKEMIQQSLKTFDITADIDMEIMEPNQKLHTLMTKVFVKSHEVVSALNCDLVVVQGDTNTALSVALSAFYLKVPVAHVEAGLRSYNYYHPYPEEMNRKLIDQISALHFAPTKYSAILLKEEGICSKCIYETGNTVVDALKYIQKQKPPKQYEGLLNYLKGDQTITFDQIKTKYYWKKKSGAVTTTGKKNQKYINVLLTSHRRENIGEPMRNIFRAVRRLIQKYKNIRVIFPVHLNVNVRNIVEESFKGMENNDRLLLLEPFSYDIFPHVETIADIVLTDSGGIQEECVSIGKPVILLRETTERIEGVHLGIILMVGTVEKHIFEKTKQLIENIDTIKEKYKKKESKIYGEGNSSELITKVLDKVLRKDKPLKLCVENKQKELLEKAFGKSKIETAPTTAEEETLILPSLLEPNLSIPRAHILMDSKKRTSALRAPLLKRHRSLGTLPEVWKIKSRYGNELKPEHATLTAVVGVYRRHHAIERFINAFLNSSHKPTEIWIVSFASPHPKLIKEAVKKVREKFKSSSIKFYSVAGDPQLSYFGRFLFTLQLKTKYIAIFDDDCIPGTEFLKFAMHMINTDKFRGVLGIKGHTSDVPALGPMQYIGVSTGSISHAMELDVVGGMWLMETDWAKLLWRNKIFTWESAEDFQLCNNVRKYLHLSCFLIPGDKNNQKTWGVSPDYIALSAAGDTTGTRPHAFGNRKFAQEKMWIRGDIRDFGWRTNPTPFKSFIVFSQDQFAFDKLIALMGKLKERDGGILLTTAVLNSGIKTVSTYNKKPIYRVSNDAMFGWDYSGKTMDIDLIGETIHSANTWIENLTPAGVIVLTSNKKEVKNAGVMSIVLAAHYKNVPILNVFYDDKPAKPDTHKMKVVDSVTSLSHARVPYKDFDTFFAKVNEIMK